MAISRGGVLSLELPGRLAGMVPTRVSAGPYHAAVGGPAWAVLDDQGAVLHGGDCADDLAGYLADALECGLPLPLRPAPRPSRFFMVISDDWLATRRARAGLLGTFARRAGR
ncbi:MAG: hypothetical protein EKK55_12950 [Rhodocyclaceae bacterium]|nr:MAG: hypothetical protein EKK55_12950 [Rhodocyclaceae bacterium]